MKKNGFTLIEMLSVVVILGITVLFILPSITELFRVGNKTETELIEERVLRAAKEYVNNVDGSFYMKLYKEGDINYIYKSDLINAGMITEEEISKLDTFAGVKGELLKNDKIRYTVEYINASNNEYENEELYLMIQNLTKEVQTLKNQNSSTTNISLLSVYPVGSIYMSENNTSPEELFGGEWESYGAGRTLVGVDKTQTEFDTVGKTGGEKAHMLTIEELASHTHSFNTTSTSKELIGSATFNPLTRNVTDNGKNVVSDTTGIFNREIMKTAYATTEGASQVKDNYRVLNIDATHEHSGVTDISGSSQPHNNLQPYITVYMWKRTA